MEKLKRSLPLVLALLTVLTFSSCTPNIKSYKIRFKAPKKHATGAEAPADLKESLQKSPQITPDAPESLFPAETPEKKPVEPFAKWSFILTTGSIGAYLIGFFLVVGSLGIFASLLFTLLGLALPVAFTLSILSLRRFKQQPDLWRGKGFAIASLVITGLYFLSMMVGYGILVVNWLR